ncbi:MAG: hypothetical protein WCO55_05160 [Candidatus Falkowbacteria bacterium]
MCKANGYVGLIILIVTLAIMAYLMTMKNSPLTSWFGGDKVETAPLKTQVKQLQQDMNANVKQETKDINEIK